MSSVPKIVVMKKIYLIKVDDTYNLDKWFPIMRVSASTELKTLKEIYPEDNDIDSIIPKPNTIQTPITKSKNEYIQLLTSMIDAEVVPINRVILSSKLFDVTNNIESLTLFIKCMEEYQDKVGINSLVNGDKFTGLLQYSKKDLLSKQETQEKIDKQIKQVENSIEKKHGQLYSYKATSESNVERLELSSYILPNRKEFPTFMNTVFSASTDNIARNGVKKWDSRNNKFIDINPFRQQKFVSDFLNENSPYRGLLLYHGLGSGKSGASILVAEGFTNRKVVVLVPASLENNYKDEINTFGEISYRNSFHWEFIPVPIDKPELENNLYQLLESKGLPRELAKQCLVERVNVLKVKQTGLFMIDYTRDRPNYDSLNAIDKDLVTKQVQKMFNYKYTILHYNAGAYTIPKIIEALVPNFKEVLQRINLDSSVKPMSKWTDKDRDSLLNYIFDEKNGIDNPFNNKVLVIDEIHNLTSKMVGSGYNGPRLYELIMRANNSKIVFLSGTPVINYAYELGLMFNMLRGIVYSYKIPLKHLDNQFNPEQLKKILGGINLIDRFIVHNLQKSIEITRVPLGFIRDVRSNHVKKDSLGLMSDSQFIDRVVSILAGRDNRYQLNGVVSKEQYSMFPDILNKSNSNKIMLGTKKHIEHVTELFNNSYINDSDFALKNTNLFKNKIVGLVSFFNEITGIDQATGADLFPKAEFASPEETTVYISNYQFIEYAAKRRQERELEEAQMKMAQRQDAQINSGAIDKPASYFRVFSRQRGIFVFPPNIKRPEPIKKSKETIISKVDKQMEKIVKDLDGFLKLADKKSKQKKINSYIAKVEQKDETGELTEFATNYILDKLDIDSLENIESALEQFVFEDCDNIDECQLSNEDQTKYDVICRSAIDKLTEDNLTVYSGVRDPNNIVIDLSILSPKYVKMVENINKTPGLVFCYSQFRSVEGIEVFSKVLNANGYVELKATQKGKIAEIEVNRVPKVGSLVRYEISKDSWNTYKVLDIDEDGILLEGLVDRVPQDKVYVCCYALWTGTESPEQRSEIQKIYNDPDNRYGQLCLALLVTQSGAEGISLYAVRQVHIMEPYWNNVRITQVIGRARRIKSHVMLPEQHRNVRIFNYITKYTNEQLNSSWIEKVDEGELRLYRDNKDNGFVEEEQKEQTKPEDELKGFKKYASELAEEIKMSDEGLTSDEVLDKISKKKDLILGSFLRLLKETAIDCNFNKETNQTSDTSLKNMVCYDKIAADGEFTYELIADNKETLATTSVQSTATTVTRVVQQKRMTFQYRVNYNDILHKLHFIVKVGENTPQGVDGLNSLENGHIIYNYYNFYGLNSKEANSKNQFYIVGSVKKIDNKFSIEFDSKFKEDLQTYIRLEKCIADYGGDIDGKANEIRECHRKALEEYTHWECISCFKKYPNSKEECSSCGISKKLVDEIRNVQLEGHTNASIAPSTQSTASTRSKRTIKSFSVSE